MDVEDITEDCIGCPYLIEVDETKIFGDKIFGIPSQSDTYLSILEKCYVDCSFREGIDDSTETNCMCVPEFYASVFGLI